MHGVERLPERYDVRLSRRARKDLTELVREGLGVKIRNILDLMETNPLATVPPFEKLKGDLDGCYSRRLNREDRIVYEVLPSDEYLGIVHVIMMKGHYRRMMSFFL